MARRLSPQQRAAITRKANKKAREDAAKLQLDAFETTKAERHAQLGSLRTVTVEFSNGAYNRYAYLTRDDRIAKGDFVVVISPYGNDNATRWRSEEVDGYVTLVKVVSVIETAESITKASKWIVQRVDLTEVAAQLQRQREIALLDARIAKETAAALRAIQLDKLRGLNPELDRLIILRQELGA
jgi:hypothetical protein